MSLFTGLRLKSNEYTGWPVSGRLLEELHNRDEVEVDKTHGGDSESTGAAADFQIQEDQRYSAALYSI